MGFLAGLGDFLGGLFGAGGILSGITQILQVGLGIASLVNAFSSPKVDLPTFQMPQAYQQAASQSLVPQIPTDLLNQLQQNIANNQQISDQARQAAIQALSDYNAGRLSPQYQALLDNWYNQQRAAIIQQFQGEGQGNSTELTNALNQLDQQYQAQAANYLQTQLSNALNLTGLTNQQVADIMNAAGTTSSINAQQNQVTLAGAAGYANAQNMNAYNYMLGNQLANQQAAGMGNALAAASNTLGQYGNQTFPSSSTSSYNPSSFDNWWFNTNYSGAFSGNPGTSYSNPFGGWWSEYTNLNNIGNE
jgi:hypothetical protein